MQKVQNVLDIYEVKGYGGCIAPETPIQFEGDTVGYAVKVQGFYTLAELLAVASDLQALNHSITK